MRHGGAKDGLRKAVDEYVAGVFEAMLAGVVEPAGAGAFDQATVPALAETIAANLSADSAIPAYLGRMLVSGGPPARPLFRRLYEPSRDVLPGMAAAGSARAGADPEVRAAFLLVNDLGVLILRDRIREVLGIDPLSAAGVRRWGAEVLAVYRDGVGA
jgi:hypothetical protein